MESGAGRMSDVSQRGDRPTMKELRIVLLGKNEEENKRVKNLISEKIMHMSKHDTRYIRIINSPVLQPNLSLYQIIQTVRESMNESHPGPHVFILVLQHNDFSEEDRFRVKTVLKEFSEQAIKRTILLTTDKESYTSMLKSVIKNVMKELIKECGERHLQCCSETKELHSEIFKRVGKILNENNEEYLTCKIFEEEEQSDDEEARRSKERKLNVVLCGDRTLHISNLIKGKKNIPSHENKSKVCVSRELEVCGRLINLIELPDLTRLSEDEVMNETFHCVSLCDPAVHVFLITVPSEPLTKEVKAEIEEIERRIQSRKHFMVIFTADATVDSHVTDFVESNVDCQRLISLCGGHYKVLGLKEHEQCTQIPDLLDYIENMKTEPYSLKMYMRAQEERVRHETEEKYEEKLKRMDKKIKELQEKIQPEGAQCEAEDLKCLRIVFIGKTGSGKSATGNTILGRNQFQSKLRSNSVTTVCEKGVCEVDGCSVAVVDTPGLFDTTLPQDQVVEEIMKCVSLSAPGPHAFIIVLSLGRFTQEELDTINLMKKIFGPKAAQFSIVLFTNEDRLEDESIEDYVRKSESAGLKKLLRDCGDRYLAFNNKETQDRTQVMKLIKMIEEMKTTNHGQYFTNSMFEEAEMSIKKKMEEILKKREREIQEQKEELKAKYEIEKENMKKRLEEEKRKADEERMKMENKFKEQEETLRKEFEEKEKAEEQKRKKEKQKRLEEEKQQRAEYHQMIEKMKREIEQQRSQYVKREKEREEEDRKREEKYRQDQEKMKAKEDFIIQLQKKQKLDEQKRSEEEERERKEWARKIREAENDKEEIQEKIKRQKREWEEEKERQMRKREEDEKDRREKHEEHLRELENMKNKFEKEKAERQQREKEKQKLREEREQKEREYEEKKNEMKKNYEELERTRKEELDRIKQEDDKRTEEERKRWEKKIEDIKREKEEEIRRRERERKEKEEKERDEMKQEHEQRIKEMKKKYEDEARKQAEEFNERNEQQIKELKEKFVENLDMYATLEKVLLILGTIKTLEVKHLRKEIKELKEKNESNYCMIM